MTNKLKKFSLILVFMCTSLFPLEHIEVLMIQQAITLHQKKTVREYLLKIAKDHRDRASKYKDLANTPIGGSVTHQNNHFLAMMKLYKKYEQNAIHYEEEAEKLK